MNSHSVSPPLKRKPNCIDLTEDIDEQTPTTQPSSLLLSEEPKRQKLQHYFYPTSTQSTPSLHEELAFPSALSTHNSQPSYEHQKYRQPNEQIEQPSQHANDISQSTGAVIDLTEGDSDNDVFIDEEATSRSVCFGMIKTHAMLLMPMQFDKTEGEEPLRALRDPSSKMPSAIRLETMSGVLFGYVDTQLAAPVLAQLMDEHVIMITASVPRKSDSEFLSVLHVVIYGSPLASAHVSSLFAERGLQLVDPIEYDSKNFRLANPHTSNGISVKRNMGYSHLYGRPPAAPKDTKSQIDSLFESLRSPEDLPQMEPHERLITTLYKHQKQALYFMTHREQLNNFSDEGYTLWRVQNQGGQKRYVNVVTGEERLDPPRQLLGGILADDMGLGKTIAVISLVLHTLGQCSNIPSELENTRDHSGGSQGLQPEIIGRQLEILDDDDIEAASETVNAYKRGRGGTLVVCPLSTVSNWEEQFTLHVKPSTVSIYVFHGGARKADPDFLARHDVVLTTYSVLATEYKRQARTPTNRSPLHQISWLRVVLDEAHVIKDTNTMQSKAACSLNAERRWSLTGTPVQNKMDDLYAQIKFLNMETLCHKKQWDELISKPLKQLDDVAISRLQTLMKCITLRRTKTQTLDGKPILKLPVRQDDMRLLEFDDAEQALYTRMENHATDTVEQLLESNTAMKNYVHILQAILRLRQLSVHPALCDVKKIMDEGTEEIPTQFDPEHALATLNLLRESGSDQCGICYRDVGQHPILSRCEHLFCRACIDQYMSPPQDGTMCACAICRTELGPEDLLDFKDLEAKSEAVFGQKHSTKNCETLAHSTKVRALVQDLNIHKVSPLGNPSKSVVFSQWTSLLDLIEVALSEAGIIFTRLDGGMTRAERTTNLDNFKANPEIRVMLISLKAGGVGLNLTCAQRVYLMDPYWNPSVESQAIDRVHRMGQTEPVTCVRFIMKGSIEEKILEMQARKLQLSKLTFDKPSKQELLKRRLDDIKFLVFKRNKDPPPEEKIVIPTPIRTSRIPIVHPSTATPDIEFDFLKETCTVPSKPKPRTFVHTEFSPPPKGHFSNNTVPFTTNATEPIWINSPLQTPPAYTSPRRNLNTRNLDTPPLHSRPHAELFPATHDPISPWPVPDLTIPHHQQNHLVPSGSPESDVLFQSNLSLGPATESFLDPALPLSYTPSKPLQTRQDSTTTTTTTTSSSSSSARPAFHTDSWFSNHPESGNEP